MGRFKRKQIRNNLLFIEDEIDCYTISRKIKLSDEDTVSLLEKHLV